MVVVRKLSTIILGQVDYNSHSIVCIFAVHDIVLIKNHVLAQDLQALEEVNLFLQCFLGIGRWLLKQLAMIKSHGEDHYVIS